MLHSVFILLLLANYLLVVGAGLVAERPAAPAFSAVHPYVHSKQCQQQNYLRLDCFEECNGHRQEVQAKWPAGAGLHFLAQLKGLDAHYAAAQAVPCTRLRFRGATTPEPLVTQAATAAGFGSRDYPPPRRG